MTGAGSAETRRAIGRIQRLCCLGLGGQALMPALMSALHDMIPNSNRQFWWLDPQLRLANFYLEGPSVAVAPLYLSEFYDRMPRGSEEVASMSEVMRRREPNPVADAMQRHIRADLRTYRCSDFYNLIMRPSGMMQGISVKLPGRSVSGTMNLWRTDREPAFTRRDFALLEALHGFIAHAMHDGPGTDAFADTEDRALVIVDPAGRLLHLSAEAHRLLLMALLPRWLPETARRMHLEQSPELAVLARRLTAAFGDGMPAAPPVLRRRNAWGEFVLRAYWLGAHAGEPSRFIGITLDRREPRSLGLLRRIEALALSEREKQLCLLLASGQETVDAARVMGVSAHTAITHRRNLYNKLGVASRMALIERLQTP